MVTKFEIEKDPVGMSTKRKIPATKKNRAKQRKVEYDEEDISSEHDSDVDDAETGSNADGEDAAEDDLTDVSNIPELPPPEVKLLSSLFTRLLVLGGKNIEVWTGVKNDVAIPTPDGDS